MVNLRHPTLDNLKKFNGESVTLITFAENTIMKYLEICKIEDANVAVLDGNRELTTDELSILLNLLDKNNIPLKYIYIQITEYGLDLYNLSPNNLPTETFMSIAKAVAKGWSIISDLEVNFYPTSNSLFENGFHID